MWLTGYGVSQGKDMNCAIGGYKVRNWSFLWLTVKKLIGGFLNACLGVFCMFGKGIWLI